MLKLGYGILLAFFGSILVHIAVVFLVPRLSEPRVVTQLQLITQDADPAMFSGADGKNNLRGMDPFFRFRVCFFDLDDGVFQLSSNDSVPFFSASLLSQNGELLFSITDRQSVNNSLSLEVRQVGEQQRLSFSSSENTEAARAVPVYLPVSVGYAVIRAFVPDPSFEGVVSKFLKSIECQAGN